MGGSETANQKNRRTRVRITHKGFQSRFIVLCFGIGFVTTLISLIGLYVTISTLAGLISHLKVLDWNQVEELLGREVNAIWSVMITVLLINLAASVLFGLLFSQRVSGLLYRLTNTLNDFADGKPVSQVVPRKGDFFVELAAAVNRVTKKN